MNDPAVAKPTIALPIVALLPYGLLVVASAFWAGNVVAGRALAMPGPDQISPAILNALRWGIALIVLAPFVLPRLRAEWGIVCAYRAKLLLLGVVGIAGYYLLFYKAVQTVPAVEAGLIVGAMPAAIMVLALMLGTERVTGPRLTGLAAALVGSLLTVGLHDSGKSGVVPNAGDVMIVAAVLCWSVYTVVLKRWSIPLSTLVLTFCIAFAGLLATLLAVGLEIASGTASIHWTSNDLLLTVYVALFPAIGSTLCWNEAVRRLGVGTPGVFLTLIPIFSTGLAATLLKEQIGLPDVLCLALVAGGVMLVVKHPARTQTPSLSK